MLHLFGLLALGGGELHLDPDEIAVWSACGKMLIPGRRDDCFTGSAVQDFELGQEGFSDRERYIRKKNSHRTD